MDKIKFKNQLEFDYVASFYIKLNVKSNILNHLNLDRFITYNSILEIIINSNRYHIIDLIKHELSNGIDINLIFIDIIDSDDSDELSIFSEIIQYYYDLDLIKKFTK